MDGHLTRGQGAGISIRAARAAARVIAGLWRRGPLYRARLKGRHPLKLLSSPDSPFGGSPELGELILDGCFRRAGHEIRAEGGDLWQQAEATSPDFFDWLQGFTWLEDLAAIEDETAARASAEALVQDWIDQYHPYHRAAWRPELAGRRVLAWTLQAPLILSSPDLVYRSLVLNSLARQGRHLALSWKRAPQGPPRAAALLGLAASGALLPEGEARLMRATGGLERMCRESVLADGGTTSRSPAHAAQVAESLVLYRLILEDRGQEPPEWVQLTLDRMLPFLKAMAHSDRSLARFGDFIGMQSQPVKGLQKQARTRGGPIENATQSGFLRVLRGKSLLIVDVGPPPHGEVSIGAGAGTLAFEFGEGAERIIVNAVAPVELIEQTGEVARPWLQRTAAQSTLALGNLDSTRIKGGGRLGAGVTQTRFARNENEEGVWIDAQHDGYRKSHGYRHCRRLFIDSKGADLRGEDRLEPVSGGRPRLFRGRKPIEAALYFQLHPDITPSLTQEGTVAILRLASSKGWMFKVRGGDIAIEDGVYFEGPGYGIKTSRLVVRAMADPGGTLINWSFKKIGSRE